MAENIGTLSVAISGDASGLSRSLAKAQSDLARFGEAASSAGKGLSLKLTAPLAALGAVSLRGFDAQAKAVAGLENRLRRFGDAAGELSAKYQREASRLQDVTLFGDEEILGGVTNQLLTFGNIAGDVFDRTQAAALDVATTLGTDVQSAAIQLGKALNDPSQGLTALSRSGITFTDQQKEQIKALQDSNRLLEAQGIILTEVERFYGGAAQAAAQAGTGPFKQAANAVGDAFESIGAAVADTFGPLAGVVKRAAEDFKAAFDALPSGAKRAAVALAAFAASVGPALVAVGALAKALAAIKLARAASGLAGLSASVGGLAVLLNPVTLGLLALGATAAVIVANFGEVRDFLSREMPQAVEAATEAFRGVRAAIASAVANVADAVRPALSAAADLWREHGDTVVRLLGDGLAGAVTVAGAVVEGVARAVGLLARIVGPVLSAAIALADAAFSGAGSRAGEFADAIRAAVRPVRQAADDLRRVLRPALDAASRWWETHRDDVVRFVKSAYGFARDAFGLIVSFVGGAVATLVSAVAAALRALTGDWQGGMATLLAAVERIAPGVISAFDKLFSDILTRVAGFGIAVQTQFGAIGQALGQAISGPAARALGVLNTVTAEARRLADAFPQDTGPGVLNVRSLTAADILAPDAESAIDKVLDLFKGGGGANTDLGAPLDDAADSGRTLAEALEAVRKQLAETLAGIQARTEDGLIRPLDAARERVEAFRRAYDDALAAGGGVRSASTDRLLASITEAEARLRSLRQTATGQIVDFRAATAQTEDFKAALQLAGDALSQLTGSAYVNGLRTLEGLMATISRGASSIQAAAPKALDLAAQKAKQARRDYELALADFTRSNPKLAQTVTNLFGSVERGAEAARNAIQTVGGAFREAFGAASEAFLGSLGIGLADTRERIAEIQSLLRSGDLGTERAAELREELSRLRDTLNPLKAGFRALGDVFSRVLASLIADIGTAIAKALVLAGIKAAFGVATGGVGGFLLSAIAGSAAAAPAAIPQVAQASSALDLVTRQLGPARFNPVRNTFEIAAETHVRGTRSVVQRARDSGGGDPFAGGVFGGF